MDFIELVKEFNTAFGVNDTEAQDRDLSGPLEVFIKQMEGIAQNLHVSSTLHSGDPKLLRLHLLQEELAELASAIKTNNRKNILDALIDLQYVLTGAIIQFQFENVFEKAFKEIHKSNMSKLEDGKPVKDQNGRVLKGKNYIIPDLTKFI